MRAILTNFGTTGDAQPFLALAVELAANGHHPVVALSPYYESWVRRFGVDFAPIGPDLRSVQRDINTAMAEGGQTFEELQALFGSLMSSLSQTYKELLEVCRGADVLICGPVQPAGRMVHEVTGIPFVSVQVANFGGSGAAPFQQASASLINPFRQGLGLAALRDPLTVDANSQQLALYAVSRHVYPPPLDWPDHYHVAGYFFLNDEAWQPDARLVEFLAAGEPPVVVTFGSTTYSDSDKVTDMVVQAIKQAGCRAIIQEGWSGLGKDRSLPPGVISAGIVPHEWLFARASCVVHHGGAGTAAAVFRAGTPSVFVTHAGGQPLRAQLAKDLGCSGPAIPYKEMTADRLASAIADTLGNHRYKSAAAGLAEKIRTEQGVKRARLLIEQLVHRVGLSDTEAARSGPSDARAEAQEVRLLRRNDFLMKQRLKR